MLDGTGLWELVEQRAEATSDARLLVDETGEAQTYGELRGDAEQVELVDALPRNPSGKVVKTALRERFGAEAG